MGQVAQGGSLATVAAELDLAGHIDLRERLTEERSEIYLGRDRLRGAMVVVKVEREPLGIRRLATAARAMARVQHPALQKVVAVGSTLEAAWMVTDLADMGTLDDLMEHTGRHPTALHLPEVQGWLAAVAAGLVEAHSVGVVHGDVSPSNIFLSTCGSGRTEATLGDFGSAMVASMEPPPGGHTPRYAAPERRSGGLPTEAGDTYGVCATALACFDHCNEALKAPLRSLLEEGVATDPDWRPQMSAVASRLGGR